MGRLAFVAREARDRRLHTRRDLERGGGGPWFLRRRSHGVTLVTPTATPVDKEELRFLSAAVEMELQDRGAFGGVANSRGPERRAVRERQRRPGFGAGRHRGLRLRDRRVDPAEAQADAGVALHAEE